MAKNNLERLKRLPPEERIERLMELAKKNEEEIKRAQEEIKKSEGEIEIKRKIKEDIPIPQLRAVDISDLFSAEEKQIYATKRYVSEKIKEEPFAAEKPLEQTIGEEKAKLTEEQKQNNVQYQLKLQEELMDSKTEDIYSMIKSMYQKAQATGELPSSEDMSRIYAAQYVAQKREEEIHRGTYGRISEEVSNELVVTQKMAGWLSRLYKI